MKLTQIAGGLFITALVFVILILGKDLLIPLAVAIVIWFLINALRRVIGKVKLGGKPLPHWLISTVSILAILGILVGIGQLVATNIALMSEGLPAYSENFKSITDRVLVLLRLEEMPSIANVMERFNLSSILGDVFNSLTSVISNSVLILIYVAFLLLEQSIFGDKIKLLFKGKRDGQVDEILTRIQVSSMKYISIKSLASFLTGLASFIVLSVVGVDFALFWAFLIFLLNFIPTIGSLLATGFPALMALVQFDTLGPFVIVLIAVGAIQLLVGNVVEPKLMGDSLNISPLVVMLSLVLWGAIWGIVGMFLCVPITVILIIIFAQFDNTRPMAILLSANGKVISADPESREDLRDEVSHR